MKNWKIPLYKVFTDNDDLRAVSKVIKRGMEWANGTEIQEFEQNLSKYLGTQHCVALNSGTSALHASLLAVNVTKGNDVIVPSFTFISTANSSLMVNAKPKFVDIENETLGLNPQLIEKAISKKTKAILPVHYAGLPCNITAISQIAKRKKIILIEDAAESLGASIKKKKVGTFGDLSIFSFAGNKVLTTGEGGVVTTNSKKLYKKLLPQILTMLPNINRVKIVFLASLLVKQCKKHKVRVIQKLSNSSLKNICSNVMVQIQNNQ